MVVSHNPVRVSGPTISLIFFKTIDLAGRSVRIVPLPYPWGFWHPNSGLAETREKKVLK